MLPTTKQLINHTYKQLQQSHKLSLNSITRSFSKHRDKDTSKSTAAVNYNPQSAVMSMFPQYDIFRRSVCSNTIYQLYEILYIHYANIFTYTIL